MTDTLREAVERLARDWRVGLHAYITELEAALAAHPAPVPDVDLCGLCKKPATGLASIGDTRYCHGDEDASPTCYEVACWRETGRVSSPMDTDTRPGLCACGRPGCSDGSDTAVAASSVTPMPDPYKSGGMLSTMTDPYRGSDTADEHEGCDCTELCSMGPTCPGGSLAGLPGSGCWRTRTPVPSPAPEDERETDCDCGHPIWWHHETKGCTSNAHGGRLCWCQAQPEALQATHDAALVDEREAKMAEEIRRHADHMEGYSLPTISPGFIDGYCHALRLLRRDADFIAARAATKAVS